MNQGKRLNTNVPGNFYVTSTCINCDQCRQIAPHTFSEVANLSAVTNQPNEYREVIKAFYALISCPTGAIGSEQKDGLSAAMQDFLYLLSTTCFIVDLLLDTLGGRVVI